MGSISVPINTDSKVQPGWVYLKEEKKFYPYKDKQKLTISSTPCVIEIKELPLDDLHKLTGTVANKDCLDDSRNLNKDQSFKMIYCMLKKTKVMKPLDQEGIDYEFASEIYYCYGIMAMLKHYKKYGIPLEKIQNILNQWLKGSSSYRSDEKDTFDKIHSVHIYREDAKIRSTYRSDAYQAFGEIMDVFKNILKEDKFESVKANVRTLPPNVNNHSMLMCSPDDGSRKSSRNRSSIGKFWNGIKNGLGVASADYEEIDSARGNAVNVIVSIIEGNLRKQDNPTTNQNDYCNKNLNSVDTNNIADKHCKRNVNAMSNNNINLLDENKIEIPNSETNKNFKVKAITQANTPQVSFDSKTVLDVNIPKPAPRKHFTDKKTAENSNKDIVARTKNQVHEVRTNNKCKESSKWADADSCKLSKENKKALGSSTDAKKTTSVKLQPVRRSYEESGFTHQYYFDVFSEETSESSKKTLLLFGTDDPGKLSLLNLLFHCSQPEENLKEGQLIDVASEVKSISFYHFLSHGASVEELIVVITPKLTTLTLENLKKLLSDGILNVNALGFVVNSRSETLTSDEGSFFNFIRSSFGEVSNHHLMTFLSFCDFSRNFPVLEEMKQQSIKSKCTLELFCCELINVLEPDDSWSTLIPRELKKGKKVFKVLKDMGLLSVKSLKIAQEKSFTETHCADAFKQLVKELKQFAALVQEGKDNKENVKPIWRLARLVLTLEGNKSSEKNLLDFMTKVLAGIESDGKRNINSWCFLLLLLNSPERNSTAALLSTLDYYYELISSLYYNSDAHPTCSVLTKNNEVAQFCNNCKDIHRCNRDTSYADALHVKCLICRCSAKSHSLWTFQDSRIFSHSFCPAAMTALKDLCDELPREHLIIEFSLFLGCLSKIYPKYEIFLKAITESSNFKTKGR